MNILLVEDNKIIWKAIKKMLEKKWYNVDWYLNWEEAIDNFDNSKYNLVVLDWMLPEFDWISVLDHIRNISDIPVIITTSKSQLDDKKEGFSTWADDYLVKPFEMEELYIRIINLLKRTNQIESFTFDNIDVFPQQHKVMKDWVEIKLTNKEFLILDYLIKNQWTPVSRTDIIDYIWWSDWVFDWDDKLDVYISNIRRKTNKDIIQTVKWFWYKVEK